MDRSQIHSARDFDIPYDVEASRPNSNRSSFMDTAALKSGPLRPNRVQTKSSNAGLNKEDDPKKKPDGSPEDPPKKGSIKLLLQFILNHFGMIMVVILYVCGGAFLFQLLEQHTEIQNCQLGKGDYDKLVINTRTSIFNYIYFNTTANPWLPVDNSTIIPSLDTPKDGPEVSSKVVIGMINDYKSSIRDIVSKYKYSGQDCELNSLWNYYSALLFTASVVSTIGYGHIAPTTWEGQIVCVCYATLGIPLFLMSVAKISGILGDMFRFLYSKVLCYVCINHSRNSKKKSKRRAEEEEEAEENANMEGDGKIVKTDNDKELAKKSAVVDDDEDEKEEDESFNKVTVPLFLVLSAFVAYIAVGASIFFQLEEWKAIPACYFAFVSLSTMGFGDMVPGLSKLQSSSPEIGGRNLLIATIYIFFGMAILGMCFELMQDELVEKVSLIAKKLGLSQEEPEEDEKIIYDETNAIEEKSNIETDAEKSQYPQENIVIKDGVELQNYQRDKSNLRARNSLSVIGPDFQEPNPISNNPTLRRNSENTTIREPSNFIKVKSNTKMFDNNLNKTPSESSC